MKPSLVMFHGWGYQPSIWHSLAAELDEFQVLMPELHPSSPNIDTWADSVQAAIPVGSLILGWSLGALLALNIASRHPTKIAGLVLIGASPRFAAGKDWIHGMDPAVVAAFKTSYEEHPRATLKRFLALQVLGDSARNSVKSVLEPHLLSNEEALPALSLGLEILATADLRDRLPITTPCSLLHGERDALMPLAAAHMLHSRLPRSRLIILPESGHAPLFADTAALAALIRKTYDEIC